MRALIERGLQTVLEADEQMEPFALKDFSVEGDGPAEGIDLHNWQQIQDLLYEEERSDC